MLYKVIAHIISSHLTLPVNPGYVLFCVLHRNLLIVFAFDCIKLKVKILAGDELIKIWCQLDPNCIESVTREQDPSDNGSLAPTHLASWPTIPHSLWLVPKVTGTDVTIDIWALVPKIGHGKPFQLRLDHKAPARSYHAGPSTIRPWMKTAQFPGLREQNTPFRTTVCPAQTINWARSPQWLLSYGCFSLQEQCGRDISIPQEG